MTMIGFLYVALIMLAVALVAPFAYLRINSSPPGRAWTKPWHQQAW